jgi:hypothetical protein
VGVRGAFLMGIIFAASLSISTDVKPQFTPSNIVSRNYNIYETYLGPYPLHTYWKDWGGWYDNPITNNAEVYVDGNFLIRVYSLEDCCLVPNSIYDEPTAGTVYINVPKHTWLYANNKMILRRIISFASGPKDPNNPTDDMYNEEHWPVRLEVPKLTTKLSDVISGLTKYSTFDFTLYNDDGYFDDLKIANFFNAPSYIKKTWIEKPNADNFIPIRYGIVESIKINSNTISISCADLFRTFEESILKIVKDVFFRAAENLTSNLPIVYGTVKIPLVKINTLQYVAGENITGVTAVYNKDGNGISYSFNDGIITTSQEAHYALVIGNTNNKIGQIIVDILAKKTNTKYVDSFWDISETNMYIDTSPAINIAFTDGSVRESIKNTLMSDMCFLIQKNDGRFTLRKWGQTYNVFNMENWEITKAPVKEYSEAQKNYLSSCFIKYNYDIINKTYADTLLYDKDEYKAEENYNKVLRKEFKTLLINKEDAFNLAAVISSRFSTLKETIQIGVGRDTSGINLLDTVNLKININDRGFSQYSAWIVKEIDPAQDMLTLEPVIPL